MALKKNAEFEALQREWYQKLKKEGFQEIEDVSHPQRLLKEWDSNFFRNQFNEIKYQATLQYYQQARVILTTYRFERKVDRIIWELHCEGYSERRISKEIKVLKKSMVHYIIHKISRRIKRE